MPDSILLIAQSARMLAVSARRGGWRPLVLDRFGDLDTRKVAHAWRKVPVDQTELNGQALIKLAQAMVLQFSLAGWVYGSGLESLPEVVEEISQLCPLLGNGPEVLRLCSDPELFFAALDTLQIPYPDITWRQPKDLTGWLAKQGGGCGGVKVALTPAALGNGKVYFQKRLPGEVFTYAFLADKRRLVWGAFNRLYQADYNAQQPFGYAGAINRAALSPEATKLVKEYAWRMIEAWHLRGMHGLDFMVTESGPAILELNPRAGAVLGLWDEDWPDGLLAAHVQACQGECRVTPEPGPARGLQVVFSREPVAIPRDMPWPSWCVDLPDPSDYVGAGKPVCSVTAQGNSIAVVERRLRWRKHWVERQLAAAPGLGIKVS